MAHLVLPWYSVAILVFFDFWRLCHLSFQKSCAILPLPSVDKKKMIHPVGRDSTSGIRQRTNVGYEA